MMFWPTFLRRKAEQLALAMIEDRRTKAEIAGKRLVRASASVKRAIHKRRGLALFPLLSAERRDPLGDFQSAAMALDAMRLRALQAGNPAWAYGTYGPMPRHNPYAGGAW